MLLPVPLGKLIRRRFWVRPRLSYGPANTRSLLRLCGPAGGCHLHGAQRAIGRRNSPLLSCEGDPDGEHYDCVSAADTAAAAIRLAACVFVAGMLGGGFCAASLGFQVAALEHKSGIAARRGAGRPRITVRIRSCGMRRRRNECKPAVCSHAARNRHAAGDIDHHPDAVRDDLIRHAPAGHPSGSTHAHRAVALRKARNLPTPSAQSKCGKSPRRRHPILTASHPARRPLRPDVHIPFRTMDRAQVPS